MNGAPAQLSLMDYAATRGSSRRSDPDTSRAAARSMDGQTLRDQQALVLETVARIAGPFNHYCASAFDVVERLGSDAPQQSVVAKRIGELVDLGMVEDAQRTRPGRSSRACRCFSLTERGWAWVRARGAA